MLLPEHLKMKVDQGFQVPTRANPTDAGFDIYWGEQYGEVVLRKGEVTQWYDLGFAVEIPLHWCLKLYPRSSAGKAGLQLSNGVGIIDHTFRTNIHASFYGRDDEFRLKPGQRFAQALLVPAPCVPLLLVDEIKSTDRGGMGSSGL